MTTFNTASKNKPAWLEYAGKEAWIEAQRRIGSIQRTAKLQQYADDPVAFGREVLHETYTPDVEQVMYSVRDNPVTIARSGNATGKSHGAARIAIWFFRVFEDAQVYLTAAPPFENLRRILWGEVASVVRKEPDLFRDDIVHSMSINRHEQSFITCVAIPTAGTIEERQTKFSGKHAPHLLFVVDEGDAVPEEVYQGIESCMSGGMARMLIMFNPKVQSGHIYSMEMSNKAAVVHLSAMSHPNVLSGDNIIPGAVDREITVRRINEWTRPLSVGEKEREEDFEVPDFLVGSVASSQDGTKFQPLQPGKRRITEEPFYYMVLGNYPAQGERQLISEDWITRARMRHDLYVAQHGDKPPGEVKGKLGLDVAEFGTDSNVACVRYGSYITFNSWSGVDTYESAVRALALYKSKNCEIAFIDATGLGSGVAPMMAREGREFDVRAISVKVASTPSVSFKVEDGEFYQLRDQLWWILREWLRKDESAMLPNDGQLLEELRTPSYKKNLRGKIVIMNKDMMREKLKRSPDRAEALALTFTPVERPKVISLA